MSQARYDELVAAGAPELPDDLKYSVAVQSGGARGAMAYVVIVREYVIPDKAWPWSKPSGQLVGEDSLTGSYVSGPVDPTFPLLVRDAIVESCEQAYRAYKRKLATEAAQDIWSGTHP